MVHKLHKKSRFHENAFQLKPRFSPTIPFTGDAASTPTPDPVEPTPVRGGGAAGGNTGLPSAIPPKPTVTTSSTAAIQTPASVTPATAVTPSTPAAVVIPVVATSPSTTLATISTTPTALSTLATSASTTASSNVVLSTPPASITATPTIANSRVPVAGASSSSPSVILNFTPSSIPPVQPTSTNTDSGSGLGTGSIVGVAAASIAGVAVLGAAGFWLFKKYIAHKDDSDEPSFTRHSWMRNSVAIPDDSPGTPGTGFGAASFGATAAGAAAAASQGPNTRPRPPTMIERHQANVASMRTFSPAPAYDPSTMPGYGAGPGYDAYGAGPGYGAAAGYDSYDAQAPMRSISPGQHYSGSPASPQPYFNPIASPPPMGRSPAPSDNTGHGPVYFSRHDSQQTQPMVVPGPENPNPYVDHPYAAPSNAQYANMERDTAYPTQTYQGHVENAASPFADPIMPAPPAPLAIPAPISLARSIAAQERGSPSPPLSPARVAQVVHVPDAHMHAGRETPVQFGYSDPAVPAPVVAAPEPAVTAPAAAATTRAAKRMSVASKKSVAGRPETMYDDDDAYAGI